MNKDEGCIGFTCSTVVGGGGGREGLHRAGGLRGLIRNKSCCETYTCPQRLSEE